MAITFDIETIPQQTELTAYQQEMLDKKIKSESLHTEEDPTSPILIRRVMGLNPFLGEIICIGTYDNSENKKVALIGEEKDILVNFWELIKDDNHFISFNGLAFDINWIILKSTFHKIVPPKFYGRSHPFFQRAKYRTDPHFDIAAWATNWDARNSVSLKVLCERMGVSSSKEGEVRAENVEEYFKAGKINLIAEYCLRDVMATYECALLASNFCS